MTIYLFLADGFEEIEAITPLDILLRAKLNVKTVGVTGKTVTGAHGITVTADITAKDINFNDLLAVILPGGMPGALNLKADKYVKKAVTFAAENNKLIAAICAAPSILGEWGLLEGKSATCYPGFEEKLKGAVPSEKRVLKSGNIITASGAGVAAEFGFLILDNIKGSEASTKLKETMLYI